MNFSAKNRQQLLTVLALAVIGLWVTDRIIVAGLMKSWQARKVRIADLRKSVAQGGQLILREKTLRTRWENMRTNSLAKEAAEAESRILKAVDQWSQESRISITSIKPQWKHSSDDFATLEIRVDGYGSLSTITHFLHELEKDPLPLKVEALELSSRDNDGSQITLGLQVSGLQLSSTEP